MIATVTGGTTATGGPASAGTAAGPGGTSSGPGRRRAIGLPRASTTPGKVRLVRAGLVILCLGWGALAALMIGQHPSAAGAAAGSAAFTGAEAGVAVLALAMAAGCTWGLSRRLAEYR